MRIKEKVIFKNQHGKIIRFEDTKFGGFSYSLFDSNGNYIRDIPSVFAVKDMRELFPVLAN